MDTKYNLQNTLEGIQQLNFHGNIIPHTWNKHITFENGKPDLLGMMILAEIVYWYRPTAVKDEKTGELIGYRKKFKADKLQRSIGSFADQFGVSKRQVSETLKRLEDHGLILREYRTLDTSMGKIGNVLYIVPVLSGIIRIQSGVPLMQSNVIGDDPDDDPSDDSNTPYCIQMHEGVHSNAGGYPFECSTYTKNTTQITAKITEAAASELPSSRTVAPSAAVANTHFSQPSSPVQEFNMPPMAESLIGTTLTESQLKKIKTTIQELKRDSVINNSEQLFEEMCHGLLEPRCFSKIGNNFHRKLNAIKNSIRNSSWETPATLLEEKQELHHEKVQSLKEKLAMAHTQINYCNQMLEFYSQDTVQTERLNKLKAKYESEFAEVQEQLSAILHPRSCRSHLNGEETPPPLNSITHHHHHVEQRI